ncbi:uncharacterized protein LOC129724747 [Wyeomyia smithii]|uniref:uncharacterized protein LOC129724747 n=1 Tax=Wyeomyia smithii TaxID=174621 RepID=UPI002467DB98|nr:uncharacterized protein LOC129724747 [Wyeomyia smithii]XP_055535867.1 uncharacterized protein LOC129724747 [Wyeomyia smithii]
MALKIPFLLTVSVLWLYWLKVPDVANSYASVTCHSFQQIGCNVLYDFVTHSAVLDKWLSVVSFVASDQRPLGVGKSYKVIMDQSVLHFNVTEYVAGRHIALESAPSSFHPRVEFWFHANNLMSKVPLFNPGQPSIDRSSSLPVVPMVDRCGTANVISGEQLKYHHHRQRHHHDHQHRLRPAEADCQTSAGSSLSLKFYFKHNSLLFQETLGSLLRLTLQQQFRRSLRHLELILNDLNDHRLF